MKLCYFTGIQYRLILLWVWLFSLFFVEVTSAAQDPENSGSSTKAAKTGIRSRPLCGLCCLYTIMKSCGKNLDFMDLVKPKYIGALEGSSLQELKQAAEDFDFHAEPVGKLTASILRQCPYKIILHVKSWPESKEYDHYELFLGTGNLGTATN